jgi:thymidylate kinase
MNKVRMTLDGIDGTGKSTQLALTADWLRGAGHDVGSFHR